MEDDYADLNMSSSKCFAYDDADRRITILIFFMILGTPLILFGIIGNIVAAVVLTRKYLLSGISILLAALAVYDTLLSLVYVLLYSVDPFSSYFRWTTIHHMYTHYALVVLTIAQWLYTGAVYLTLAAVFGGLLSVLCHKLQRFAGTGSKVAALVIILLVTIFSLLFNVIHCFTLKVEEYAECPDNSWNKYYLTPSKIHGAWSRLYHELLLPIVNVIWPFYLLWMVTGFFLIMGVVKLCIRCCGTKARRLAPVNRAEGPERSYATAMPLATYIGIAVLFLICNFVGLLHTLTVMTRSDHKIFGFHATDGILDTSVFLGFVNTSCKVLIYYGSSELFRQEFCATFCGRRRPHDEQAAVGFMMHQSLLKDEHETF